MNKNRTADLHDTKVDVKVVLCGLWISMLFVFAYVDIFGLWRADVINGALAGKVPGAGFEINQAFLVLTRIYILIPSIMVIVSLLVPARVNRPANIFVSLTYLLRLSLVVAACLLVEAVVAKNVLEVELDVFSQFAAPWVYIAFLVTGLRDRSSSIAFAFAFAFATIGATAAVLALYAL